MKLLKIFSLCVGILLSSLTLFSQKEDKNGILGKFPEHDPRFLAKLPEYEIKNPAIYSLLEGLDELSEDCIFCILNQPYYYRFYISFEENSTTEIKAVVEQHAPWLLEYRIREAKSKGFFYHHDILAIVYSNGPIDEFFELKDDSLHVFYNQHICLETDDEAGLLYSYSDGRLSRKGVRWECPKKSYFSRQIRESDTRDFLVNQCQCTDEILNYEDGEFVGKLPKNYDYLYIKYSIDKNREVTMNRISYEKRFPMKRPDKFFQKCYRISPIYQNGFYIGILF